MLKLTRLLHIPDLDQFDHAQATWSDADGAHLRSGTLAEFALDGVDAIALLPITRVTFIETPLPAVNRTKRDALLRFAIEDKLTIDPSTVHAVVLDTSAQNSTEPIAQHIVSAVDREWFSRVVSWLHSAHLNVSTIAPVSVLGACTPASWLVNAADVARAGSAFMVREDGFAIALDDGNSLSSAVPFALTLALAEARKRERAPQGIDLLISAATENAERIGQAWAEALQVSVRVTRAGEATTNDTERKQAAAALLRRARQANIAVADFTPRSNASHWATALKPAWILGFAALTIFFIGFALDTWRLQREAAQVQAEMRRVFVASFPQATAIVDAPLQMSRNLESMRIERGIASNTEPMRALLAELAPQLSASALPRPLSVNYDAQSASPILTVVLPSKSAAEAAALQKSLPAALTPRVEGNNVVVAISGRDKP